MKEEQSHEKSKDAWSSETDEETVFQSWSKRRREVIEITRNVNDDALEEIMVRLPVKSLIRFQTVSKHWRRMITSKTFRERHMLHQKTLEPRFLCCYEDESWYKPNIAIKTMGLDWSSTCLAEVEEEEEYHIGNELEAEQVIFSKSLDGLFCFYGLTNLTKPIKVINPATRWSLTLPLARTQLENLDNKTELHVPGFGKDDLTGTYKLVWLHCNNHNNTSSCEVFDFGVKQWRQVMPPPPYPDHGINQDQGPILANGWLYWFIQDKTKFIAFDVHMEVFLVVPNPVIVSHEASSFVNMHMCSVDDDRRLVWISETSVDPRQQHVWRLTNHNTGGALSIVGKMFSFELNKICSTWFDDYRPYQLLQLMVVSNNGNKVVLSKHGSQEILLYQPINPTSILYRIFSISPPRPKGSVLLPYFPSLSSPL